VVLDKVVKLEVLVTVVEVVDAGEAVAVVLLVVLKSKEGVIMELVVVEVECGCQGPPHCQKCVPN
jgi:hypothetical protein